jgi:hypothetical protein
MPDLATLSTNASTQTGNNTRTAPVENSIEQFTYPAAIAMDELTPVYIDSNGKFAPGDASVSGTANVIGLTVRKVAAGEAVTAIAQGEVGGLDLSGVAYGADVYLSDTTGKISTAAGTVSKKIGTVVGIFGQTRGTAPAKALRVTL